VISLKNLLGSEGNILSDRSLQLLLLANMVYPMGTTMISPMLESLIIPLSTTPAAVGLLVTAFFIPLMVLSPIAGGIADVYGRKPLLIIGLLIFGFSGLLMTFSTSFLLTVLLRLLQGIGGACILPVVVTSLGDLYTGTASATAQGLRSTSHGVSGSIFPIFSGVLVLVAWNYPFLLYIVPIPIALILYLFLEEPSTHISQGNSANPNRISLKTILQKVPSLLLFPRLSAAILGMFLTSFVFTAYITYSSLIIVLGISGTAGQAGILVSLFSASSAIAATQSGRIYSYFKHLVYPFSALSIIIGGGLIVVALSQSLLQMAIGASCIGIGFGILFSLNRVLILEFAPEDFRGILISFGETAKGAGATLAPVIMGLIFILLQSHGHLDLVPALRLTNVIVGFLAIIAGIFLSFIAVSKKPEKIDMSAF
jgi:ACDE family multidrug resistance protein